MKRARTLTIVAILAAWSIPAAAGQPATATAGTAAQVAAEIGPTTVLLDDLRDAVAAHRRDDLARNRLDAFTSGAVDRALDDLVDVRLFALAARAGGVDRQPDVARRIQLLIDQELARIAMARAAAAEGITDRALREYYDSHSDQFRAAPRVHAHHIAVRTREEAVAARQRIDGGQDFIVVARELNVDSTKPSGGDLGWISRGAMVRPFDEQLFAQKVGQLSEPVQTAMGFHIVRVDEIEPGKLAAFDEARDDVRRRVVEARIAIARARLTEQYPIVVHTDRIDGLKK